ncbi:enoyl-CoA hydratase/isomerase family protein [Mycolicibacterium sp. 120270]|uniref:enoyl-CoA hydratase/isomerase family protein n=1 Tax=Mycolicibacterium sp. 120270 TaxID=3090600 RepID=UPI00299E00FC|nr:enoyl-CoA hydratase/isomerase family protein [Mycolicibacterium sp. 120270]MDX1884725.1 enoyl-CoA hydratase/isomerase family protein [Mycolicibacterium sp. 120270]
MIDERRDGFVTWLTLDRPERLNAFTADGYRELRIALQRLAVDDQTRVAVITGRGRAFSAGADLSLLDGDSSALERQRAGEEFGLFLQALAGFAKPLFAAVNGLAVGIGATMLLYCDVVFMAESARLRLPFTALGIVPEAGSSVLLPARVRWADAMWAMLSSEWIDATATHQMGLASRLVPDDALIEQTATAAATVAVHDPLSVAATKRLMTSSRQEIARAAIARELAEMATLASRTDMPS